MQNDNGRWWFKKGLKLIFILEKDDNAVNDNVGDATGGHWGIIYSIYAEIEPPCNGAFAIDPVPDRSSYIGDDDNYLAMVPVP